MSTLYLQVDDAAGDSYPVRLGVVDVDRPGAVLLEDIGTLPVALPPVPGNGSMGVYLHELVAAGGGARLADLLNGADVRSVAVDVRPADLAALPWETMDPGVGGRYLFINDERPWSRGRWDQTDRSVPVLGPLRLLVVVCDPRDESLRADEELDGIHRAVSRALGRIHLEVIDSPPDWAALRQEIVDLAPHVVHLIGHTRQTQTQSVLEFTPADPDPTWELTSDMISQLWPAGPRLVVVSACKSGGQASTGVISLTNALKAAGVSAVLGMRGDISSAAAVNFATEFYGSLADDKNVDTAAAAGRRAILTGAPAEPDWHYPVLETLVPAAHVLPVSFGVDIPREDLMRGFPEFAELQRFVDRSEQRRKTWWAIDPEGLPGRRAVRGAVLITGPRGSGKTWLARASLLVCYWRGRRLHYVDLMAESPHGELRESTKDWLGMLRAIRDGTQGCQLSPELDAQAFATFNARLNWLVKNPPSATMPTQADGAVEDERQPFAADNGQVPTRIAAIFKDFLSALEKAAAPQQIVLVLDGVEGVMELAWRDFVMPHLIAPLAKGINGVSLLLIVPQDLLSKRLTSYDIATMEYVEVWEFKQAQINRVIREYGVNSLLSPMHISKFQHVFRDFNEVEPSMLWELEKILRKADRGGR